MPDARQRSPGNGRLGSGLRRGEKSFRPGQGKTLGRRVQMALHGNADNHDDTRDYGRYVDSAESPRPNLIPDGVLSQAHLLPDGARCHEQVPGWQIPNADTMDVSTNDNLFWGAKRVDGRNALWIGTRAEAHLEPSWDLSRRIPVKGGTGYSASCQLRGQVAGEALWSHCSALVIFYDEKGTWLGHHGLGGTDIQKTPGQWQPRRSQFITPAGATSIGFRAGSGHSPSACLARCPRIQHRRRRRAVSKSRHAFTFFLVSPAISRPG